MTIVPIIYRDIKSLPRSVLQEISPYPTWNQKTSRVFAGINWTAYTKGQLILKAIYGLLTSPKKGICFVCFFNSSRQTNQIRPFVFWENLSTALRQSAFRFYLNFKKNSNLVFFPYCSKMWLIDQLYIKLGVQWCSINFRHQRE